MAASSTILGGTLGGNSESAVTATTGPRTLHLAIGGNDSNDGLSAGTAKATAAGIDAMLPHVIAAGDFQHVLVGPGTYLMPEMASRMYNDKVMWDGTDEVSIFAAEASGAGTDEWKVEKVGGGLTVDAHLGESIAMTSGAAINSIRLIIRNDATHFYVGRQIGQKFLGTTVPVGGDSYRVFRSATRFESDKPAVALVTGVSGQALDSTASEVSSSGGVVFKNIEFGTDGAAFFAQFVFSGATVWLYGVSITPDSAFTFVETAGSSLYTGGDTFQVELSSWPFAEGLTPTSAEDWCGWGLSELDSGGSVGVTSLNAKGYSFVASHLAFTNVFLLEGGSVNLFGRIFGGTSFLPAVYVSKGELALARGGGALLELDGDSTTEVAKAYDTGSMIVYGRTSLTNSSTGRLLVSERDSTILVAQGFLAPTAPTGLTGGATAVEAVGGGHISFQEPPLLDSGTPAVAYKVAGTTEALGFFTVVGDIIVATDGSHIQLIDPGAP